MDAPAPCCAGPRKIGPATAGVIQTLFERRTYPQHAFRAALGILRLAKGFGAERLEAASQRALRLGACSYKSLDSILKQGLDQQPLPEPAPGRRRARSRQPAWPCVLPLTFPEPSHVDPSHPG